MFIDSHCHIEDEEAIFRARDAGVTGLLNAGKDLDEAAAQLELCEAFERKRGRGEDVPYLWTSAGVHPDSAKEKLARIGVEEIVKAARHEKVIAIGECGLDYHYGADVKEEQKEMFYRHIEAAGMTGLPLMIHEREAEDDMLFMLREGKKKYPGLTGVIHCFSSDALFAAGVCELSFYISASGIVTFKNAADIREVFKDYPADRLLIETDSPYLAPVPFRGKVNEPAFIVKTAEKLSEIRGLTIEETARITRDNFYRLYQKARQENRKER